jgi:hypothetical protein
MGQRIEYSVPTYKNLSYSTKNAQSNQNSTTSKKMNGLTTLAMRNLGIEPRAPRAYSFRLKLDGNGEFYH